MKQTKLKQIEIFLINLSCKMSAKLKIYEYQLRQQDEIKRLLEILKNKGLTEEEKTTKLIKLLRSYEKHLKKYLADLDLRYVKVKIPEYIKIYFESAFTETQEIFKTVHNINLKINRKEK